MSKAEDYTGRTEALLAPIMEENGFELVDTEFVKEGSNYYLRAYIDKPGGITIDDCELVSRALDVKLDEEDFIEEAYILEISSPGLGRPLKKDKDFTRSIGEEIEIHFYRAVDGSKDTSGILKAFDDKTITIETDNETEQVLERKNISLVRLAFDF